MTTSTSESGLLEVRDLQVHYPINSGLFQKQVGESGCGKNGSRYLPPASSGLGSLL